MADFDRRRYLKVSDTLYSFKEGIQTRSGIMVIRILSDELKGCKVVCHGSKGGRNEC
jgi:hypothetical protein